MSQQEDLGQEGEVVSAQALAVLHANKVTWANMEPARRLQYLKKILVRLQTVDHEAWGAAAV